MLPLKYRGHERRLYCVIAMSDIPWGGPIAGVSVGLVDGEIVLNPTEEQREHSDLSLTLAASEEKIVMIEAGANEVDEETMMKAIRAGHEEIKKMLAFINSIVAEIGKPKNRALPPWSWITPCWPTCTPNIWTKSRPPWTPTTRTSATPLCCPSWMPSLPSIADLTASDLDLISYKLQKKVVRTLAAGRWQAC